MKDVFSSPFGEISSNNYSPVLLLGPIFFGVMLVNYGNIVINIILGLGVMFLYDKYFKSDNSSQYIVWSNHQYLVLHYLQLGAIFILGLLFHYHWGWSILLLFVFLIIIVLSGLIEHESIKKLYSGKVDFSEFEGWEKNSTQSLQAEKQTKIIQSKQNQKITIKIFLSNLKDNAGLIILLISLAFYNVYSLMQDRPIVKKTDIKNDTKKPLSSVVKPAKDGKHIITLGKGDIVFKGKLTDKEIEEINKSQK